jgi:hypothetical protein
VRPKQFDQARPLPDAREREAAPRADCAAEAQAIVDQAVASLGIDPREATNERGWRLLKQGAAKCHLNILPHESGSHCFVAVSPILRVPDQPLLRDQLFESLLRLNLSSTLEARFGLDGDWITLQVQRRAQGLDVNAVLSALDNIVHVAAYTLKEIAPYFDLKLPKIQVRDKDWPYLIAFFRTLDAPAQAVVARLLEGWKRHRGVIRFGTGGPSLCSRRPGHPVLAGLMVFGIVMLPWDSLNRLRGLPAREVQRFQRRVPRPPGFETKVQAAYMTVGEDLTPKMATQLLQALRKLDDALVDSGG